MLKEFYNLFGYNEVIFSKLNYITNIYLYPEFFLYLSKIFEIFNFVTYYLILLVFFAIKVRLTNLANRKIYFDNIYNELFRFGLCYAAIGIIYSILKFGLNMPRPYCHPYLSGYISIADFSKERCLSSFPSAHISLAIMACYFLLPYIKSIIIKIIAIIIVILVGISRISLAMHFPSDLIYSSFLVGIIICCVNYYCKMIIEWQIFLKVKNLIFRCL